MKKVSTHSVRQLYVVSEIWLSTSKAGPALPPLKGSGQTNGIVDVNVL